jgi:hypothetical protein
MIRRGEYGEVVSLAGSSLSSDRWDVEAQACLAVASYLKGRREWTMKKLREADESLPREVLDKIHDRIWELLPELLAEKEYRDSYAMKGGACILRNLLELRGTGELLIGEFFNPLTATTSRHLRGISPENRELDLVCEDCELRKAEARIIIRDYEVKDVRILAEGVELSRNVRYIKKILELEKKKQQGQPHRRAVGAGRSFAATPLSMP